MRQLAFASSAFCLLACVGDSTIGPTDSGKDVNTTDSGPSDGTVEATSDAPFDPLQLPGLALWLQADDAVHSGADVSSWPDSSNNHNNATGSTPAPQFVASSLNNHAVVRFAGTSYLTIADSASLGFGSTGGDAFVLEAVVVYPTATNSTAVFSKLGSTATGPAMLVGGGTTDAGITTQVSGQIDTEAAVFANWIVPTGPMRIMLQWTPSSTPPGGTLQARAGNSPADQKTLANATSIATSALAYVGAADFGGGPVATGLLFKGDIAEIVLFSGPTIAPTDILKLETFLNKKYGL